MTDELLRGGSPSPALQRPQPMRSAVHVLADMMRTVSTPVLVSALVLLSTALAAHSAAFPRFEARVQNENGAQVASLVHGSEVILRWRGAPGENPATKIEEVAARLNRLAWAGLASPDIKAETVRDVPRPSRKGARPPANSAQLWARGELLLVVDAKRAAASNSTPGDLAALWARKLRQVVAEPYVMLREERVEIPVGETRSLQYGGRPDAPPSAVSYATDVAEATVRAESRTVSVRGIGPGTTLVGVRAGKCEALATAVVRKWAGWAPPSVMLGCTGPVAANLWLRRAARLTALRHTRLEPGAVASVGEISLTDQAGSAMVVASGPDYFDFQRALRLIFAPVSVPTGMPNRVVLSNDPEKVFYPQSLALGRLNLLEPVNLLWHHIGMSPDPLQVAVRLCNTGSETAQVYVIGADGGPSEDEVFVGHVVMERFVNGWRQQAGSVFEVPPGMSCEVSYLALPYDRVVSGLARLVLLQGQGVFVEVVAARATDPMGSFGPLPSQLNPGTPARALELAGYKRMEVRCEVGGGWAFARIGKAPEDPTLHPRLRGDYGVVHDIGIVFDNPAGRDARLEVAIQSGGGPARGVIEVDGQLISTGLLSRGVETLLWKQPTGGATRRVVQLRMIPQSGSNYPVTITARTFPR